MGGIVGGSRYLKRCLQALLFSFPAVFRSFAFPLLARLFRSSSLTESVAKKYAFTLFSFGNILLVYAKTNGTRGGPRGRVQGVRTPFPLR